MPHVIVSGGPGAGKTTLLAELAARGHETVDESARAVIAERLARGESPRPIVEWYRSCGYMLDEVPPLPVAGRADHVLRVLHT